MPRKKKKADPFYAREAKKYKTPIASREFIVEHLESLGAPERFSSLTKAFGIKRKNLQEAFMIREKEKEENDHE